MTHRIDTTDIAPEASISRTKGTSSAPGPSNAPAKAAKAGCRPRQFGPDRQHPGIGIGQGHAIAYADKDGEAKEHQC